jgi:hypothetical protein
LGIFLKFLKVPRLKIPKDEEGIGLHFGRFLSQTHLVTLLAIESNSFDLISLLRLLQRLIEQKWH